MKKIGFTLAEILITLGIIGVIAAIIMPALFSNVERTTLEKQTLKFYNRLTTAFSNYKADNESPSITNIGFNPDNFVRDYFTAERCANLTDCFSGVYTHINGDGNWTPSFSYSNTAYKLKDGSVFLIDYNPSEDSPIIVYFDVNGQKGPNRIGRDLWSVDVFHDGSVDESWATPENKKGSSTEIASMNARIENRFQACLTNQYSGCFGHFMRNDFKFDY